MCEFLSGVVTKDGTIWTSPVNDAHEDIIAANSINELFASKVNIVRVEYTSKTLADIDTYALKIDQDEIPDWFDDAMRERIADTMRGMVSRMIIKDGTHACLLGGKWVIAGDSVVIKKIVKGNVLLLNSGKIELMAGGQVNTVGAGGQVNEVWDGGQVNTVWDGGQVNTVWAGGQVNTVWDGGQVNEVRAGGQVNTVWAGGQVNEVWDGGQVNTVRAGGQVNTVWDGGKILDDRREK